MRETVNSVRVRAHTHCSVPEMPLLPLCPASWYIVLCSSPAAVRGTRTCKSLTSWKRTSSHVHLFRNGHRFYVDLSFFIRGATHQQTYQRICYSHEFEVPSMGYLWHMWVIPRQINRQNAFAFQISTKLCKLVPSMKLSHLT